MKNKPTHAHRSKHVRPTLAPWSALWVTMSKKGPYKDLLLLVFLCF